MLEELGPVGVKYIESPTYIAGDNAAAVGVAMLKKSPPPASCPSIYSSYTTGVQ